MILQLQNTMASFPCLPSGRDTVLFVWLVRWCLLLARDYRLHIAFAGMIVFSYLGYRGLHGSWYPDYILSIIELYLGIGCYHFVIAFMSRYPGADGWLYRVLFSIFKHATSRFGNPWWYFTPQQFDALSTSISDINDRTAHEHIA